MTTNIVLGFFVWFFIPETKSVALEEIDVLFGGANHTEKGGDLLHVEDPHHAHAGDNSIPIDAVHPVSEKISPAPAKTQELPAKELDL